MDLYTENLKMLQTLKQETEKVRAEVVGLLSYVAQQIDEALDLRGDIKLKRRFQRKERNNRSRRLRQKKIDLLEKQFVEKMNKLRSLVLPLRRLFHRIKIGDYIDFGENYQKMEFSKDGHAQCTYALDALQQLEKLADKVSPWDGVRFEEFKERQKAVVLYSKQVVSRIIWIIGRLFIE